MKHLNVVGAIFCKDKKILAMQRAAGKYEYSSFKYEFPGGKIEEGESRVEALKREIKEEMDVDITFAEDEYFTTVEYPYPDFTITMHTYLKEVGMDFSFRELEHAGHLWVGREEIKGIDWLGADFPIIDLLILGNRI